MLGVDLPRFLLVKHVKNTFEILNFFTSVLLEDVGVFGDVSRGQLEISLIVGHLHALFDVIVASLVIVLVNTILIFLHLLNLCVIYLICVLLIVVVHFS